MNNYGIPGGQKAELNLLGEFDHTTEWRKDQWLATEDSFPKSLVSYLECSEILNAEEVWAYYESEKVRERLCD